MTILDNVGTALLWLFLLVAFAVVTVRRKSLSVGGAVAAGALGAVVLVTVGPRWLVPLFVFFLSSNVIGRVWPVGRDAGDVKDKLPRDAVQVLCNGGLYGVLAAAGAPLILLLVVMAVATSDTWASEIGKHFRQATYDILRRAAVPPGLSGGVSSSGTLGGAAGAGLIGALGFLLLPDFSPGGLLLVAGSGFVGMLLDSLLGAAAQARYGDPLTGTRSDIAAPGGKLVSGYEWMTNDLVNLLSIGLATGLAAVALHVG